MKNNLLDFSKFENSNSKFTAELQKRGANITFSNSGKGGDKKYFNLSLESFLNCLKDIKNNISEFLGHEYYVEKEWRELGSSFFKDRPANAQITVQTKPMFATLSKIIMWANSPSLDNIDPEQNINLELLKIEQAITTLDELTERFKPLNLFQNMEDKNQISYNQNEGGNTIVTENKSLRQFALNVFRFTYEKFGQEFIIKHLTKTDNATIGQNSYNAIRFPKYFSNTNMLAVFNQEQNKQSLTTGRSQRYSEENLKILGYNYIYFNFQWSHPQNSSSADFYELKSFIEDWAGSKYSLTFIEIKGKKTYQLISKTVNKMAEKSNLIDSFQDDCNISGLTYSNQLITRYISSLATKPFVLLSGLSGSGKTKLAEAFAKWICESDKQYTLIPVGADWTNREPLLGYPNALKDNEYVKPDNDALDLLMRAKNDETRPYFLILDEMNLSHVERYFADFLSTMESDNFIPLHKIDDEVNEIPKTIKLPKNLFIVGTVNIDETTYMFSPKVLDRANTIEFRVKEGEILSFLDKPKAIDLNKLQYEGASMGKNFIEIATGTKDGEEINEDYKLTEDQQKEIHKFFVELQKSGAEFGYRTAFEISKLIFKLEEFGLDKIDVKTDIAIMQKMLPKLHGSRTKLTRTLKPLAKFCLVTVDNNTFDDDYFNNFENIDFENDDNIKYKISFEKIMRMYKNAVENGFASYAEA